MSMDDLAWGRPAALIRHCGGANRNKFLPGSVLKRTSRVRTMKRIWIGAKLQAWGYNCGHGGENRTVRHQICTEESDVNEASTVYCAHCGAAINLPAGFCGACGQPLSAPAPQAPAAPPPYPQIQYPQPQNPQPMYGSAPQGPAVMCPFCHSTQVQAGKRGWKWTTGYIGSSKIVWTCLSCGKRF